MADYDFTGLTLAQERLLTFQGWPCGQFVPKPRKTTVQPLIDRGLVRPVYVHGAGRTDVARYEVPIAVHAAWCFAALTSPNHKEAGSHA